MKVVLGWDHDTSASGFHPSPLPPTSCSAACSQPSYNEVLQFVLIWLGAMLIPDPRPRRSVGGWSGMKSRSIASKTSDGTGLHAPLVARLAHFQDQPDGHPLDRHRARAWLRGDFLRILDHGLSSSSSASFPPTVTSALRRWRPLSARRSRCSVPVYRDPSRSARRFRAVAGTPRSRIGRRGHWPVSIVINEVLPIMLARYCGPGTARPGQSPRSSPVLCPGWPATSAPFRDRVDVRHLPREYPQQEARPTGTLRQP